MEEYSPLVMTEEFWRNNQLSVARFYGGAKLNGKEYVIVDKMGRDLFETAIPPGEPADLIVKTLQPAYKKLGRDRVIELVQQGKSEKEIIELAKKERRKQKTHKQHWNYERVYSDTGRQRLCSRIRQPTTHTTCV